LKGSSLEDAFDAVDRRFSIKTVLLIVDEVLTKIERIHNRGIIHRDIKPANVLLGKDEADNSMHFIDFGLAEEYWNQETNSHIHYSEGHGMTGTERYTSISSHQGIGNIFAFNP
jgi:serine/threonine protein kinase